MFEPRIIVISSQDFTFLLKSLSGDTFIFDASNSPIYSLSLPSEEINALFPDLKEDYKDYKIQWIQPSLKEPMGRELWVTLQKFQPNIFFIFIDQNVDYDYYNGLLQNLYSRILESLDTDFEKAEKLAREHKIIFLVFYRYRSLVLKQLVQFMHFFNSFKQTFEEAEVHERKIDFDAPGDLELLKMLIFVWDLFQKKR